MAGDSPIHTPRRAGALQGGGETPGFSGPSSPGGATSSGEYHDIFHTQLTADNYIAMNGGRGRGRAKGRQPGRGSGKGKDYGP